MWLIDIEGYWGYWHGAKGYSGVALLVKKAACPDRLACAHPAFDFEHRIVTADLPGVTVASIYVPNGGKDFDAKMRFLEALDRVRRRAAPPARRALVLCGDLNVARTEIDVHPKERKPRAIGQLPEERALIERILSRGLADVQRQLRSRRLRSVHLVGAVAQHEGSATSAGGWTTCWPARRCPPRAVSCRVLREFGTSDHGPVVAEFA